MQAHATTYHFVAAYQMSCSTCCRDDVEILQLQLQLQLKTKDVLLPSFWWSESTH